MDVKSVAIGCDHAGFPYKAAIVSMLADRGIVILDFGTNGPDSVDYADFVHPVADSVERNECDFGVIICGSGNGVAMTANKHQGIRAALCWQREIAALARSHNDANVIALPARFISQQQAVKMVEIFMNTEFEGGRHARRVNKIPCMSDPK